MITILTTNWQINRMGHDGKKWDQLFDTSYMQVTPSHAH
jgi:hypothetical protein